MDLDLPNLSASLRCHSHMSHMCITELQYLLTYLATYLGILSILSCTISSIKLTC